MKATPTKEQLQWADLEIGVIIHYDITVFEQKYKFRRQWGYHPDVKKFAPSMLDTDQWLETAKNAGAKYAVLVAKHCTGFALFPSKANEYNVKNATYNKDIVLSFVNSCKKYEVKPGVYYSTPCNAYENVDNPGTIRSGGVEAQQKYNQVVRTQLEELWGNYGEWFEIWFDGGTLPVEKGGLDIAPILNRLQPNAITFQGDRLHNFNNLRWIGNEMGYAGFNCYSTINGESQADGTVENKSLSTGDKDGSYWKPAECDAPNRYFQWMYKDNEEWLVLPYKKLMEMYYKSVGRNCNLLLGMVIDKRGLVPDKDAAVLKKFGEEVRNSYINPIAITNGCGKELLLKLKKSQMIDQIIIKEDLSKGHSVYKYKIQAKIKDGWKDVFSAEVIGHKRIARIRKIKTDILKLIIEEGREDVNITEISAFYCNNYSIINRIKLMFNKWL